MKAFRIFCLVACVGILVYHFFNLDYEDLRFKTNQTHYFGIFAMILVGLSMLLGIIRDRNKNE